MLKTLQCCTTRQGEISLLYIQVLLNRIYAFYQKQFTGSKVMDLSQNAVSSSPKIMLTVSYVEKDGSIPAATFVEALVFMHLPCDYVVPSLLAKI